MVHCQVWTLVRGEKEGVLSAHVEGKGDTDEFSSLLPARTKDMGREALRGVARPY